MEKISVIVPIYNAEKYLVRCLDSLIHQSYQNLEIVLVDDASPDNCPKICDEYAARDSRIVVLHTPNGGSMKARQVGFHASTGEYIGFADSDDVLEETMFAELAAAVDNTGADIAMCDYYIESSHSQTVKSFPLKEYYNKADLTEDIYPVMVMHNMVKMNTSLWNKLYKRELLENNMDKVDERAKCGEDAAVVLPCLLDAQSLCYVKKPLYHYYCIEGSIMTGYDPQLPQTILLPSRRMIEKKEEGGYDIGPQIPNFVITAARSFTLNEARCPHKRSAREEKSIIREFVTTDMVNKAAKDVNSATLSRASRLFAFLLRKKWVTALWLYIKAKRRYLHKK